MLSEHALLAAYNAVFQSRSPITLGPFLRRHCGVSWWRTVNPCGEIDRENIALVNSVDFITSQINSPHFRCWCFTPKFFITFLMQIAWYRNVSSHFWCWYFKIQNKFITFFMLIVSHRKVSSHFWCWWFHTEKFHHISDADGFTLSVWILSHFSS